MIKIHLELENAPINYAIIKSISKSKMFRIQFLLIENNPSFPEHCRS
jgi:hypothetical protein